MAAPTTKANTLPTVFDLEDLLDLPPVAAASAHGFAGSTLWPGATSTPADLNPVISDNTGSIFEVDESSTSPTATAEVTAVAPTEPELSFGEATTRRLEAREKLKSAWERIFEKYGRDFDNEADEIDVATCKIVVDRGHLRRTNTRDFGDLPPEPGAKRRRSKRLREMNVDSELELEDSDAGTDEEADYDTCSVAGPESKDHNVDSTTARQVAAAPRRIEYDLTPLRTRRSGLAVSRPDGLTVVRESRYELRRGTVQSMYLSESRVEYARGSERRRAVRSVFASGDRREYSSYSQCNGGYFEHESPQFIKSIPRPPRFSFDTADIHVEDRQLQYVCAANILPRASPHYSTTPRLIELLSPRLIELPPLRSSPAPLAVRSMPARRTSDRVLSPPHSPQARTRVLPASTRRSPPRAQSPTSRSALLCNRQREVRTSPSRQASARTIRGRSLSSAATADGGSFRLLLPSPAPNRESATPPHLAAPSSPSLFIVDLTSPVVSPKAQPSSPPRPAPASQPKSATQGRRPPPPRRRASAPAPPALAARSTPPPAAAKAPIPSGTTDRGAGAVKRPSAAVSSAASSHKRRKVQGGGVVMQTPKRPRHLQRKAITTGHSPIDNGSTATMGAPTHQSPQAEQPLRVQKPKHKQSPAVKALKKMIKLHLPTGFAVSATRHKLDLLAPHSKIVSPEAIKTSTGARDSARKSAQTLLRALTTPGSALSLDALTNPPTDLLLSAAAAQTEPLTFRYCHLFSDPEPVSGSESMRHTYARFAEPESDDCMVDMAAIDPARLPPFPHLFEQHGSSSQFRLARVSMDVSRLPNPSALRTLLVFDSPTYRPVHCTTSVYSCSRRILETHEIRYPAATFGEAVTATTDGNCDSVPAPRYSYRFDMLTRFFATFFSAAADCLDHFGELAAALENLAVLQVFRDSDAYAIDGDAAPPLLCVAYTFAPGNGRVELIPVAKLDNVVLRTPAQSP
ncbi:hypothetical protein HK405_008525 [Cladochytrium tenue]|nr:hypothetical protein HK405_008525 [Cladochytrium tenue]